MSYQVLARKWRPRNFSTLVGQEHVVRALTHALDEQRLHHAYLFTGTRGVGKTTLARILAKALNCEAGISAKPCGRCLSCEEIDAGRFVDLIEVDAATNTKAEEMRELLEKAVYAPTRGRFKVYVIDEVHMLSGHAFNAMLKTLEEPPEHVKFVLATTDPQKIPVTVLSRCLQFNLKQMPVASIVEHLARILQSEAIAHEGEALTVIARAASGSMRDALSLLDQAIAHGDGKVEAADVREMLGAVDATRLLEMLEALAGADVNRMLAIAHEILARGLSAASALQELALLLTRLQYLQLTAEAKTGEGADAEQERLEELARRFTPEFIQLAYQIAVQGRAELPLAPDEQSGLVMTILRLFAFAPSSKDAQIDTVHKPVLAASPAPPEKKPDSPPSSHASPAPLPEAVFEPTGHKEAVEDGNEWHRIFDALQLTGISRQLARNCDLIQRENDFCLLHLPPEHQALLNPESKEKLQQALSQHFGIPVRLTIEIASPERVTPAQHKAKEQARRQEEAVADIEADPFIQEARETLGAKVDKNSIQPLL